MRTSVDPQCSYTKIDDFNSERCLSAARWIVAVAECIRRPIIISVQWR